MSPFARIMATVLIVGLGASPPALHAQSRTVALGNSPTTPANWVISSQYPGEGVRNYEAAIDHSIAYDGSASALLKSKTQDTNTHGTLMQSIAAGEFVGKRVSFSAYVRTRDLAHRAGLWIRAEDSDGSVIAFKNMFSPDSRGAFVQGDSEWQRVEMIVDVPSSAKALYYGVQMWGSGSVWIDHVQLAALGSAQLDQPAQGLPASHPHALPSKLLPQPANLDFED